LVRILICIAATVAVALFSHYASAHSDGAPWGAAIPSASENCVSCHFDSDAIHDSPLLRIEGLPSDLEPGATYELTVSFDGTEAATVGFQAIAQAEQNQTGTFTSTVADVEFIGAAIRSTAQRKNDGGVKWIFRWHVPTVFTTPIVLHVAVNASNDDGSALGDRIYFRSYRTEARDQ
jgi:hypothetical protein